MSKARKVHVKSFGCQMNVYDSHRMADTLAPRGLQRNRGARGRRPRHPQHLPHPREGGREGLFRARPDPRDEGSGRRRDGRDMTDRGRRLRRAGRRRGDHAPRAGGRSGGRAAELSPPAGADRARAGRRARRRHRISARGQVRHARRAATRSRSRARGITAFVTVQEGCDKFCTFCVVPYTRGAEFSRPVAKIVAEVERLADAGRARGHAARAERQRLSRRRPGWRVVDARRDCCAASPRCPASRGFATPPAIRATWTTS